MRLVLWDERYERATDFEYMIPILVDGTESSADAKAMADRPKEDIKNKKQAGRPGQQQQQQQSASGKKVTQNSYSRRWKIGGAA